MPKEIVLQSRPKQHKEELERLARLLLSDGADSGDDAVMDLAIKIAYDENLDVVFRTDKTARMLTPAQAYRLRYERGLDIRDTTYTR